MPSADPPVERVMGFVDECEIASNDDPAGR